MLVKRLMNLRSKSWPFLEPVDPVSMNAYDYFEVVKRPMDLGTVDKKLENNQYSTCAYLLYDVLSTFKNACLYNPPENKVHQLAQDMLKIVEEACVASPVLRTAYQFANRKLKDEESQASGDSCGSGEDQTSEKRDEPDT